MWELCRYGLALQPAVRGLHLQPISLFGRYPAELCDSQLTLPELMRLLVAQSGQRLRGCCIHVSAEDDRLIPFCAYNLTSQDGRALYRGRI